MTNLSVKKVLISVALFIGGNSFIQAQDKIGVGIMPFTSAQSSANAQTINSIQETVVNAFVKTKRFNIVDRSKMEALKKEKNLQKSEDFIDGSVIAQGVALGANFLISGHIISATAERMEGSSVISGESTATYKAKLSIDLKVIDVATGQIITSERIEPKGGSSFGGIMGTAPSTPEAAILKAIKGIEDKIDKFVDKNFPVTFHIVEIQEKDGKGNATKIMIAGGSAFNLKKGDKLKVVEVSIIEVNGKKLERKKELGELRITKVEDENFSTCSVKSGGVDINAKFEAKAKLLVITQE